MQLVWRNQWFGAGVGSGTVAERLAVLHDHASTPHVYTHTCRSVVERIVNAWLCYTSSYDILTMAIAVMVKTTATFLSPSDPNATGNLQY